MTADIDREKLRRPSGNNADEWHAFLSELLTNRADSPSGLPYMAVQISEAIDEQIAAQLADRNMTICMQAAKIAELEARLEDAREEYDADTSALNNVILNLESERDQLRKQVEGQFVAGMRGAEADVVAERRRQIEVEGRRPESDDCHKMGQLAGAAACYILNGIRPSAPDLAALAGDVATRLWPWSRYWWKPTDRRRDLVKAGALIIAEIERLDRAAILSAASALEQKEQG